MAAVNALGLPKDSPFKDPDQIPYPKPLQPSSVWDPTQNEEEDSLSMRELVEEIESYTEVIEFDIPGNPTTAEGQMTQSTLPNLDPQMVMGVPPNPPEHTQNPEA